MKSARERSLDFWMISLSRSREREREREREKNVGIGNPRHSLSSRNWEKKAKKIETKTLNIKDGFGFCRDDRISPPFPFLKVPKIPLKSCSHVILFRKK